jgi:hypothetical protein
MNPDILSALNKINVIDYVAEIPLSGDYVSYRYIYSPCSASKREARYNRSDVDCFYIADSVETAQHEVRFNFDNKELYTVKPGSVFAFDARKFAQKFSFMPLLTSAQTDGGYQFCQDIAEHLTKNEGLSGIYYPSRQMVLEGKTGMCIALLPNTWQLNSGKLEIFERKA